MKIGILTFYFAHNYGAMLQAYALKSYLTSTGHEVSIVPYHPLHFQRAYSVSPWSRGLSIKRRAYNLLNFAKRVPQARLFERFKEQYLYAGGTISVSSKIDEFCRNFDLILFGSDQIWNFHITNRDLVYFGSGIKGNKASYAASMGNEDLSRKQAEEIKNLLLQFEAISVRESVVKHRMQELLGIESSHVCDPVFLLSKEEWRKIEKDISVKEPYMLVYMLKDDEDLLNAALEYAKANSLEIYEVHPTLGIKHDNIRFLNPVGPGEFLSLISHAECVCTNSFHGFSFAIIHEKKVIHIPNPSSPERTLSLLEKFGEGCSKSIYHLDFGKLSYDQMNNFIDASKNFLNTLLF